jgi:hypothetical protein
MPSDPDRIARMSLIDEHGERYVRMANMCIIGTSSTNGVAKLHSEILKRSLFKDFYDLYPNKFSNVTNGITPRRWLLKANPLLSQLITETITRMKPPNKWSLSVNAGIDYGVKSQFWQPYASGELTINNHKRLQLGIEGGVKKNEVTNNFEPFAGAKVKVKVF